jgi:LacI family transcriptional regulator
MRSPRQKDPPKKGTKLARLERPLTLVAQVEQSLRKVIAEDGFAEGRIPTELELAKRLGVSRETVRLATQALQRDGLLVKRRSKGTSLNSREGAAPAAQALAYVQARFDAASGHEDAATRTLNGLLLQGALEEAAGRGYVLVAEHVRQSQMGRAFQQIQQTIACRGAVFAHYGEEKHLRRAVGLGMPIVLVDHDLHLPVIHSVRDDSFEGARQAVAHLASQGHQRIAYFNWWQSDLNPWRLQGYRQALRDAGLPRRRRWEFSVELTPEGARRAIAQFLLVSPRPTAIYCFCNSLARLVIEELDRREIAVPDVDAPPGHPTEHILCPHVVQPGRTAAPPTG